MTDKHDGHRPNEQTADSTAELLDLSIIWQRKGYLLLSLVVTLVLGAAYLQQAVPIYEGEARVLIEQQGLLPTDKSVRTHSEFLATQAEIIRSPAVIEAALNSASIPGLDANDPEIAARVLRGLRVSPLEDTNVLKIGFRGTDPQTANLLVEAVIDSYREYVKQAESNRNSNVVNLVVKREQTLRDKLLALREQHLELRASSPQIGTGHDAFNIPIANLRNIGSRLAETNQRRMELESKHRVAMMHGRMNGALQAKSGAVGTEVATLLYKPTDDLPADPFAPMTGNFPSTAAMVDPLDIQKNLWEAQSESANLTKVYGPRHPEVLALNERIDWWKKRLAESHAGSSAATAMELESIKISENDLDEQYEQQMAATKVLDRYLLQEQQIIDEIDRVESVHRSTVEQLNEMELANEALAGGHGTVVVRVLEHPESAGSQIWPRPIQFLGVCAALGLMAGFVLMFLVERLHTGKSSN